MSSRVRIGFLLATLLPLVETALFDADLFGQVVGTTSTPLHFLDLNFVDEMGIHAEAEAGVLTLLKNLDQSQNQISRAAYLYVLAHHREAQGKLGEAEAAYREALKVRQSAPGARSAADEAILLAGLAGNLARRKKLTDAERLARQALAIWEREAAPDRKSIARGWAGLANVLSLQERFMEAEALYLRAGSVKGLAESDPKCAAALCDGYAALLRRTGRVAAALEQEARCLEIRLSDARAHVEKLEADTRGIEQRSVDGPKYLREHPGKYPKRIAEELAQADRDALAIHTPRLVRALERYAALLRKGGHAVEADAQESKANALRKRREQ